MIEPGPLKKRLSGDNHARVDCDAAKRFTFFGLQLFLNHEAAPDRSSVGQAAEAAATKNARRPASVIRMSTNDRDFRTYIAEAIVQTSSVVHKQAV